MSLLAKTQAKMFSIESGPRTWKDLEKTERQDIQEEEDTDMAARMAGEEEAAATGPRAKMGSMALEGPGLASELTTSPLRILCSARGRVDARGMDARGMARGIMVARCL